METELTESKLAVQLSQLAPLAPTISAAWSIFGLLLSLGRPASLTELTSQCKFMYTTPQHIRLLSEIPDSPLRLSTNSYVTVSNIGYSSIWRLLSNIDSELGFGEGEGEGLKIYKRRKSIRGGDECVKVKRRKLDFEEEEENQGVVELNVAEHRSSTQNYLLQENISKYFNVTLNCPLDSSFFYKMLKEKNSRFTCLINSSIQTWKTTAHEKENTDMSVNLKHISTLGDTDSERTSHLSKLTKENRLLNLAYLPKAIAHKTAVVGTEAEEILPNKIILRETRQMIMCKTQASSGKSTYEAVFEGNTMEQRKENPVVDDDKGEHVDDIAVEETESECLPKANIKEKITLRIRNTTPSLGKAKSKRPIENQTTCVSNMLPDDQQHLGKSHFKPKVGPREKLHSSDQAICRTREKNDVVKHCIAYLHSKREKKSNSIKQNICDDTNDHKERKEKHKGSKNNSVHVSEINQLQEREYPKFESYIVEEEEGSGGYGTVYRARRKTDLSIFAIKCPHVKASKNHIQKEVKMLERFGGNNFIIKYECSLKSGDSDCLVLQHVDHDRPEVLKREIDVSQLQWYAFCMFKSLAALHKQGIVHRDVKPGNFLFSRKANKGYLIDFNLALDLHQKYGVPDKTKSSSNLTSHHVPSATKSLPPARNKQSLSPGALGHLNHEAGKLQKPIPKNLKRNAGPAKDNSHAINSNIIKSRGADGSIITSTKDATSNRSAERFREPIPCQGRKELLSLVQALQGTNSEAVNAPTSKRKRVAATPGNGERKFVYVTPMPLHSTGVPIAGAGLLKNKGDMKQKREGSCVGTKGFRAPEVLVRSAYQGQKVDIWSAGVTLLYLMIGRAPFCGDPDQNIKEIAKLRGTEDLWEVAKLHNRESSFPSELFDIKVSRPIKLLDWCKLNTRRPLEIFPASLFDLVDKCLTVNPRLRISAEEALGHEFFAPCNDLVRRYRLQKQGLNLESGIN